MLEKELQDIGLNEKEAKVYLAALELGQAVVQDISNKADVNRATTYFIIEELMKKGLMSSFYLGKKQYFLAEDPEKLKLFLKQQINIIKEKELLLERSLPQLKSVNIKGKDLPVVRYFEGVEGLRAMIDNFVAKSDDTLDIIYSEDLMNKVFPQEEKLNARNKRLEEGVYCNAIYNYSGDNDSATENGDAIKIPSEQYPIMCDIAIFNNKIRILSLNKKINGIMIEDEDIYRTMKTVFKLAWEGAQKYRKKD